MNSANAAYVQRDLAHVWHPCTQMKDHEGELPLIPIRRGAGAIVNIVDLSAWEPWPRFAAHSVGKAALLALTRQLALEFAPLVRVNAVAPGPVLPPPNYSQEKIARTARRTLLERWGKPEDVAAAVLFLIQADYITGDTITVDGGERLAGRKHD